LTYKLKVTQILQQISKEKGFINNIPKLSIKFTIDNLGLLSMKAEIIYDILYYLSMTKDSKGKYSFKYTIEPQEPLSASDLMFEINNVNKNKDYSKADKDVIIKRLKDEVGRNKTESKKKDLEVTIEYSHPLPMTKADIIKSRVQLNNFDSIDESRAQNAEKRNLFETTIYAKREWIESEKSLLYGTEKELDNFRKKLEEISNWYDTEGLKSDKDNISDKINEMENLYKIFDDRMEIENKRKVAVEYFYSEINSTVRIAENLSRTKYWIQDYVNGEFKDKINKLNDWMNEKLEQQQKIPLYEVINYLISY
jgi:hypothetical protein